jgi:hypothetical protein
LCQDTLVRLRSPGLPLYALHSPSGKSLSQQRGEGNNAKKSVYGFLADDEILSSSPFAETMGPNYCKQQRTIVALFRLDVPTERIFNECRNRKSFSVNIL